MGKLIYLLLLSLSNNLFDLSNGLLLRSFKEFARPLLGLVQTDLLVVGGSQRKEGASTRIVQFLPRRWINFTSCFSFFFWPIPEISKTKLFWYFGFLSVPIVSVWYLLVLFSRLVLFFLDLYFWFFLVPLVSLGILGDLLSLFENVCI